MSKIFYIEDPDGMYVSDDGKRRFTRLEGKEAYDFLKSPAGKGRRFMKLKDLDGDEYEDEASFEVHRENRESFRRYERRGQYVSDTKKERKFKVISLNFVEPDDEDAEEHFIIDDMDVEYEVMKKLELEELRRALKTLSQEEMMIIHALFFSENPMSEREYAEVTGIPQKTLNDRKNKILKKIKKLIK